jgi:GNAT superfamily N-acetyltransferase
VTGAEIAEAETRRLPERLHVAWVAVEDDAIVGYGYLEEPGVAAMPGRLRIRVLVDPARRRRGVGSSLCAALIELARGLGSTELVTEAQAGEPQAQRFLTQRGFAEYHRRQEGRLDLSTVDPATIAHGIDVQTDAFFPTGVRIATYRQLQLAVADAPRRLYGLDTTLWADVPFGLTGSIPTFEQYQVLELADPDFLPAATFIALDGERWIGIGALMSGRDYLLNSMTGVVRDWRGRGLARWLKLHTIRCAFERGAPEIRTFNDSVNEAILALNRSLGFRVAAVERRYRRELR